MPFTHVIEAEWKHSFHRMENTINDINPNVSWSRLTVVLFGYIHVGVSLHLYNGE